MLQVDSHKRFKAIALPAIAPSNKHGLGFAPPNSSRIRFATFESHPSRYKFPRAVGMYPQPVPSILIADDDAPFRETVRHMLEPLGYRISVAGCGEEAIHIVENADVHLMLVDMHMPRLTGVETAQRVHRVRSRLPWILMSARLDDTVLHAARSADVFSILAKPFTRRDITRDVQLAFHRFYNWSDPTGHLPKTPCDPDHRLP